MLLPDRLCCSGLCCGLRLRHYRRYGRLNRLRCGESRRLLLRQRSRDSGCCCFRINRLLSALRLLRPQLRIDCRRNQQRDARGDCRNNHIGRSAGLPVRTRRSRHIIVRQIVQQGVKLICVHSNPSFRRYFCKRSRMRESVTETRFSLIPKSRASTFTGSVYQ